MSDLIKRDDAINALYNEKRKLLAMDADRVANGVQVSIKIIESLPSADRPRGEWIEQEDDYHHYWECSECGMGVGLDDIRNFCPNCGAKMDGERKESE